MTVKRLIAWTGLPILLLFFLFAIQAHAAAIETTAEIVRRFETVLIKPTLLLIFTASFFLFVWGLFMFMFDLDKVGEHKEGKYHMWWGLIGMFIIVAVYGIIALISNTFNLGVDPKNPTAYQPDMSRIQQIISPALDRAGFTNN